MKRFLADALLICILVSIGSYINQLDYSDTRKRIEQQVADFEDEVANHRIIEPKNEPVALNDIEENGAGKLAKQSSEFVVGAIEGTVDVFSTIFDSLVK